MKTRKQRINKIYNSLNKFKLSDIEKIENKLEEIKTPKEQPQLEMDRATLKYKGHKYKVIIYTPVREPLLFYMDTK